MKVLLILLSVIRLASAKDTRRQQMHNHENIHIIELNKHYGYKFKQHDKFGAYIIYSKLCETRQ